MPEKNFGIKKINLSGSSGTPTITSPNNINFNAVNVAISSDSSVGSDLTVKGNVTSFNGFTSGIGTAVQITTVGNKLTLTVVGVGSTSLTLF